MGEEQRDTASPRLESRDLARLRCFGEAIRAIGDDAGLVWTASMEDVVSQEIDAAFSVMEATRTAFGPHDFTVFFLGHLAEALPRRADRAIARRGMMRYLVTHRDALGADLAALADAAEAALRDPEHHRPPRVDAAGRYVSDGRSVSEAFLSAYGTLRPAVVGKQRE